MDVLVSGKTSFKVEVPYKLFETGSSKEKPLIVYLHGYGQNIDRFEKSTSALHSLEAYHLYIQGPYADLKNIKHRGKWGFAWYLYNGKQGSFVKSLEYTSEFIQEIIDNIIKFIKVSRICVLGYSMGGYQAGYFGLSRWKHTNELIVINGKIKAESFSQSKLKKVNQMNICSIHAKGDQDVPLDLQQSSVDALIKAGANVKNVTCPGTHKLTLKLVNEALFFLKECGYKIISNSKF